MLFRSRVGLRGSCRSAPSASRAPGVLKILLDENFPLGLLRSLLADGQHAEHIITLGWRGASDQRIRERLLDRDVLFLTHDEDFLFDKPSAAVVVLSRVRQGRRSAERVEIWRAPRSASSKARPDPSAVSS